MKVNFISHKNNTNFGMSIEKNSILDNVRNSYIKLGKSINENSSDEFIQKIIEMQDAFDYLERSSKGVKVYVLPEHTSYAFPKCSLFCQKGKKAIKVEIDEIFFPFFKSSDIISMGNLVRIMKLFL